MIYNVLLAAPKVSGEFHYVLADFFGVRVATVKSDLQATRRMTGLAVNADGEPELVTRQAIRSG
jgi:hypothetical protein